MCKQKQVEFLYTQPQVHDVTTPTIFDGCPVLLHSEPVHLQDKILRKGFKVTSPGRGEEGEVGDVG